MKWLVTGARGMLGTDVCEILRSRGERVAAYGHRELDVTHREKVLEEITTENPDVVVNCAAYTKVDACEEHEPLAASINGTAVQWLAEAANATGARLTQVSTDFVFDGSSRSPYETDANPSPLSAYGRSKLAGEKAAATARNHLIVRTSWLFGRNGPNFVDAIRRQIEGGNRELRVVNDQRGRPTYTPHLADALIRLSSGALESREHSGMFHYADAGEATWWDFAVKIADRLDPTVRVLPIRSEEMPRPAVRPSYSVLSTSRYESVTGLQPKSWAAGLDEYLSQR